MIVQTTVTEQKEIAKEISLPYYSKDKFGTAFHRINEDESIIRVDIIKSNLNGDIVYAGMSLQRKGKNVLQTILSDDESNEKEFEEVLSKVIEHMDTRVKAFAS